MLDLIQNNMNPDECLFVSQDCEDCPFLEYCLQTKKQDYDYDDTDIIDY